MLADGKTRDEALISWVRDLTEIPATDPQDDENYDQVSYILKQVLENGKEEAFSDALSQYVSRKNSEIEKVCGLHYQEFVQSIDQLLKIREGTLSLRGKILDLNDQVQSTGIKLVDKKKEVIESRRVLLNVELALETMQSCLFILDNATRVQSRIQNRKYYSALKLLDDLEEKHLRNMTEFAFVKKMRESIPASQESIRAAVLREMRDWFLQVKNQTGKVGKYAMSLAIKKNERAQERLEGSNEDLEAADGMPDRESEEDLKIASDAHIDFTPLHQCLHIHNVLGKRNLLKLVYDENRRFQADSLLKKAFNFTGNDLGPFEMYLENMAGFFIVEAIVMESTTDLRSRNHVETLWDVVAMKLNQVISESLRDCENPELFLGIKLTVVAFIQTMELYRYNVSSLIELMVSLINTYAELMKSRCRKAITEALEGDEFFPMVLENTKEYDDTKLGFPFEQEKKAVVTVDGAPIVHRGRGGMAQPMARALEFPMTLPFSQSFPKICTSIKQFISSFLMFSDGFSQQNNEIDDLLKKSLDSILVQTINGSLSRIVAKGTINQAMQIMTNVSYFEKATVMFEEILMERRHNSSVKISLQPGAFDDTRGLAERRIHELICAKIDQFLELADYDWTTAVVKNEPSPYLLDLTAYMRTLGATTLSALPEEMIPTIYKETFEYLARRLMAELTSPGIKKISFPFMRQYEADVVYLDKFLQEFPHLKYEEIFIELMQMIDFLLSDSFDKFLEPMFRCQNYDRLRPQNVIIVVEKFRSDLSYFSKATTEDKNKTKSIEAFVKALKAQSPSFGGPKP